MKVLSSEIYKASQRISIFLPMKDEVNTLPILKSMFDAGKQCYIPHYEGQSMIMVQLESWAAYENLPINSWGIRQPSVFDSKSDANYTGGLDLIFMPGLAFSRNGARLGRGKGYYDKYLQQCLQAGTHPKTVALIFKEQLVNHIPTLEHDKFVDQVIFPTSEEINAIKT
ncbi:5-formyltetrahydrofolate cyclo-ligase-like isoform X2 [Physella acuta]|uniref:5-formyltetrahydrofolate cyclo-ligase-like isoform X2 n=1 Tax=Physella acuta TaxID=109671 RepID=UPI0027DB1A97|nr:5-formyltetrahydrofolate cyclo-ligase-like isoform X2 [Physella acuta]